MAKDFLCHTIIPDIEEMIMEKQSGQDRDCGNLETINEFIEEFIKDDHTPPFERKSLDIRYLNQKIMENVFDERR